MKYLVLDTCCLAEEQATPLSGIETVIMSGDSERLTYPSVSLEAEDLDWEESEDVSEQQPEDVSEPQQENNTKLPTQPDPLLMA